MTILYNNIGKDLSRVSMPAALNEPVCLLQRLCEELEYSELLDTANHTDDPYHRMVMIAYRCSLLFTIFPLLSYKTWPLVLWDTKEAILRNVKVVYTMEINGGQR